MTSLARDEKLQILPLFKFQHFVLMSPSGAEKTLNARTQLQTFLYNKKLSYVRRETTQRAMLINSCYVSRGMGAETISNSKSDLQGHSRALAMVPFDRPHTISH